MATAHITLKSLLKWLKVTGVLNIHGQGFSTMSLLTFRADNSVVWCVCSGEAVYYKIFSNIPGLQVPVFSSQLWQPKCLWTMPIVPWRQKSHQLRTTDLLHVSHKLLPLRKDMRLKFSLPYIVPFSKFLIWWLMQIHMQSASSSEDKTYLTTEFDCR